MKNKILIFLEKYVGAWLIKTLFLTCKIVRHNLPKNEGQQIFVTWHCNIFPFTYAHRHEGKVALVSASKDGQLIAGPLERLGFQTVRGSSGRNNVLALRSLLKVDKSMAVTVDGPKGPPQKCKPGILYLAQKKQIPIICCNARFSSTWQLPTWDKMNIPKPFSKITLTYHCPIYIGKDENITEKQELIEAKIDSF